MNEPFRIILASGSPRRKQLMEQCGFEVRVVPSSIEETIDPDWKIEDVPVKLAHLKAHDIYRKLDKTSKQIILGADTIVVFKDEILGKPANEEEAFTMLQKLSNNTHDVYTGVSICGEIEIDFVEKTTVHFAKISPDQINYYIEKYNPMDKAGAYGIQDWLGMCFVSKIEGCYTNVMGLPMQRVFKVLHKHRIP